MAIASRGKTYSDKPGWALDPKTKLELKRRKESRELPSKFGGREIVTSENREEFMAKKLKLDKNPEFGEKPDDFATSVKHEDNEYWFTGKTGKNKKGHAVAEYDYKGNRVWARPGGKFITKE